MRPKWPTATRHGLSPRKCHLVLLHLLDLLHQHQFVGCRAFHDFVEPLRFHQRTATVQLVQVPPPISMNSPTLSAANAELLRQSAKRATASFRISFPLEQFHALVAYNKWLRIMIAHLHCFRADRVQMDSRELRMIGQQRVDQNMVESLSIALELYRTCRGPPVDRALDRRTRKRPKRQETVNLASTVAGTGPVQSLSDPTQIGSRVKVPVYAGRRADSWAPSQHQKVRTLA